MRRAILIVVVSLSALRSAAAAARVSEVLVFADRAQVTRTDSLGCDGSGEIVFSGLPLALDVRTLRARTDGKATVLGVTSEKVQLEEDWDERVRKLKAELETLDLELIAQRHALSALEGRERDVGGLQALARAAIAEQMAQARPDTARWQAALNLLRGERSDAGTRRVDLQAEERRLERQRTLVQYQLDRLQAGRRVEAWRARVTLACSQRGSVTVALSYVVPGAGWKPEYDVRFVGKGQGRTGPGEVELTTAAVISQSTGEDWVDAIISLSTAKPRLGAEAPELAPIHIAGHEEQRGKVLVQAEEERKTLAGKDAGGVSQAAPELEDRGQSFVLELPRAATVRADGRPYWFPVEVTRGPATAALVTVPKLSPFVYQVVQATNPSPLPLLAGTAHVFRRGSYVGDVALEYRAPGEPMELSLGIDEELRVERQDLHAVDRGSGTLSSTQHLERAYRITVTNRSAERLSVELRENLPVSKSEEVKVELLTDKTTGGASLDAARGFVTWKLDLASGKKAVTNLAFVIHLPDSWQVR